MTKEPKKRASGPSGKLKSPRRQVVQSAEDFETQDDKARSLGFRSWSAWAASVLQEAAR